MESHGFARQPFSLERRRLLALDCRHVLHFESSMLLLLTVEAKASLRPSKAFRITEVFPLSMALISTILELKSCPAGPRAWAETTHSCPEGISLVVHHASSELHCNSSC